MKLEEIIELWKEDAKLDDLNLDMEVKRIPSMHAKYLDYLSTSRIAFRELSIKKKITQKKLYTYYEGTCNELELADLKREQYQKRIIKSELSSYVEQDQLILEIDYKLGLLQEKIDVLNEIIKSLNNRSFQIKNIIDFRKLMAGG